MVGMMSSSGTTTTGTTTSRTQKRTISLAISYPDLFGCSGGEGGLSSQDVEYCNEEHLHGGTAAFAAYTRYYHHNTNNKNKNDTTASSANSSDDSSSLLILPIFDYQSGLVQMHPLEWTVNRLVYETYFNYKCYIGIPCLLLSHYKDSTFASKRDLSDLLVASEHSARPVYSNVLVPPSNSWNQIIHHVYFDKDTNLAILSMIDQTQPLAYSQNDAANGLLTYIGNINRRNKCTIMGDSDGAGGATSAATAFETYMSSHNLSSTSSSETQQQEEQQQQQQNCWIPIIIVYGADTNAVKNLIENLHTFDYPPAAIIDIQASNGNVDPYYEQPMKIVTATTGTGRATNSTSSTWVVSYFIESSRFDMLQFELNVTTTATMQQQQVVQQQQQMVVDITNVELIQDKMYPVANYVKDEQFYKDFEFTSSLVREALDNDPIVATMDNMAMPLASKPPDVYHCFAGECPIGNLFTDAARWKVQADVAIINAGGVRGPGWEAGNVHVSDIWAALPFANMLCEVTLSGLSLVRMFNYSTAMAAYENRYVQDADRFMQVSGARVTYNTKLPSSGRLISVEIWDEENQLYTPVERLRLYKLASSSWECSGFYPFTELLGGNLTMEGEVPASTTEELMQDVVGEYLRQLNVNGTSYNATVQGRLVDDTEALTPMNWDQTRESCTSRTYWMQKFLTCMECPSTAKVKFIQNVVELDGESLLDQSTDFEATIVNGESFPVSIIPKTVPAWVVGENDGLITLQPLEERRFKFHANAVELDAGTAQATVSFAIEDGGSFPGCSGDDADFQVLMRVAPQAELNKPENIRIAGFVLMSLLCLVAIYFSAWLFRHRRERNVRARQPELYFVFLAGCLALSVSIIPFSIADELDSWTGRNMACMAVPWFLFTGFNMMMSSLYAKLWRLNKIFNAGSYRRVAVTSRQALTAFGFVFAINITLLLIWTLVDPVGWEIRHVPGEEWNRYGSCSRSGAAGRAMFWLTFALSGIILCLTAYQAIKARKISDEFSESKQLGFAVFTASQITIVSVPILFLISDDNPDAKYLLQILIIFAVCMSVMLLVFVPVILQYHRSLRQSSTGSSIRISGGILRPLSEIRNSLFTSNGATTSSSGAWKKDSSEPIGRDEPIACEDTEGPNNANNSIIHKGCESEIDDNLHGSEDLVVDTLTCSDKSGGTSSTHPDP